MASIIKVDTIKDTSDNTLLTSSSGNVSISNDLTVDTDTLYVDSANNRVGVGTTSPSQKLDVVGNVEVSGGIYLGGTASANLLDDYEEGTFTPVFKEGTNSLSFGGGGHYVKNGNMVSVNCSIQNIVRNNGSGALTCTLPFVSNGLNIGSISLSRFTQPANTSYATVFLNNGNDFVSFNWVYSTNANASSILESNIAASGSSDLFFSIVYKTV